MDRVKLSLIVLLLGSSVLLTGCGNVPNDIANFTHKQEVIVSAENYLIQPPDEVSVQCSQVPEIHGQKQIVRPDGCISFETIGKINVAGKTPEQVADIIKVRVMETYNLPGDKPIDVRVDAFKSKVFYVFGEVAFPGAKVCTGRDDVVGAIAQARPMVTAWKERIKVIRPNAKPDEARSFEVNFKKLSQHGDTSRNVMIEEGDIIYVRPTVLSAIAMVIEEIVRPIGRAFSTVNIVNYGY